MSELTLSKYSIGSDIHTAAMSFAAGAPLDDRFVVVSKESLISESVFGKFAYLYSGLVVTVANTGEAYVLKTDTTKPANNFLKSDAYFEDATDTMIQEIIDANWTKLASNKDLQDIKNIVSGIFQFKGVATAIDPDHTTLTIGSGSIDITVGETTTNSPLVSYGTVFKDNFDDIMYAWGTAQTSNLFFTEQPYTTKNAGQKQYVIDRGHTSKFINVFDTLYIFDRLETVSYDVPSGGEGSPTTATRQYEVWKDPDDGGGTLYSVSDNKGTLNIYTVPPDSSTLPDALATEIISIGFNYYTFKEKLPKYPITIFNTMQSIAASSENNGHVYQIGEEEYASNGNIWVQLGSPKTDWIVL